MFDGSPELKNLVSQAMKVNRGAGSEWAGMERAWKEALTRKPPVAVTDIEIKIFYDGSKRPTEFEVKYKVDGKNFTVPISNPVSG